MSTAFSRSSNSPRYFAPATQRAHVERDDALVLEPLGHVARDDALGQPLDDRGLAHAGLADQHGVVLRAAEQDPDDPPDLLVPADDGIELPLAGQLGKILPKPFQSLELILRVRVLHLLAAPEGLERLTNPIGGHSVTSENSSGGGGVLLGDGDQEVLSRQVHVAQGPGLLPGPF
ncbi:MAG: hypothetical protein KatS3mg115_1443 [Candidatus Poribacteria bacterium]|nr:MAG: hypothetical protein KatS3mg115_1443 [Candidatus Poribacteria bacterium]